MKIRTLIAGIAIVTALFSTSCTTNRGSLSYFENLDSIGTAIAVSPDFGLKLEPADELVITVTSYQPSASAIYNLPATNPSRNGSIGLEATPQQQTYIVDSKGNIEFPVLGTLHVSGLTTWQLADKLEAEISKTVKDPTVVVQLVNFKIAVLGEVRSPGQKNLRGQRVTLLDALATAGDLSQYGERQNVLLIREENGKRVTHKFNLNDAATLSSPYFYVKQNDVIYVYPNKIIQDNSKYNQNNAFKLSVISTIVSASSVVASLIIALAIK